MRLASVLAVAVSSVGCTAVQGPVGPNFPAVEGQPVDGYALCQRVSTTASSRASELAGWGWTFALLAAGSTVVGTTIIPLTTEGDLSRAEKVSTAAMTAGGLVFALVARGLFHRSDAASTLAGVTTSTLGERVDGRLITAVEAGAKCNLALGVWEESRTDATAIASSLLDKEKTHEAHEEKSSATTKVQALEALLAKACPAGACPAEVIQKLTELVEKAK